jgi:hypothetical protein
MEVSFEKSKIKKQRRVYRKSEGRGNVPVELEMEKGVFPVR